MRSEKKLFTDLKFCTNFGKSKSKSKIIPKMLKEMNDENVKNDENVVPNVKNVLKIKQNVPKRKKEKKKKGQYSNKHNFGETNVNKIVENIKNDPKKSSRVKRGLYTFLKKAGYKLGDYADYTLKALIKITVKYVGPIVLASLLIKYRKPISNILISNEDRYEFSKI